MVTYECYGSWAGDKMTEILWVSVQISTWYFRAMRMLILCVGGDVFSRCSGFSVWDVLQKASHAPKMQANATKMLISDLIAVAIYSTNLKDLNCYGDARASCP